MNLVSIINELRAERAAGDDMAQQLVARIDAHIRDLELTKAWIIDSATARAMTIDGMLGGENIAGPAVDLDQVKPEAA
jgi:hypothetical protein